MDNASWFSELKSFLDPHPELHPHAGEIYVPKSEYRIRFLFSGVEPIEGDKNSIDINFNSDRFVILAQGERVVRILWSVLVGFELIPLRKPSDHEAKVARSLH